MMIITAATPCFCSCYRIGAAKEVFSSEKKEGTFALVLVHLGHIPLPTFGSDPA
jgi:hypothetical protein